MINNKWELQQKCRVLLLRTPAAGQTCHFWGYSIHFPLLSSDNLFSPPFFFLVLQTLRLSQAYQYLSHVQEWCYFGSTRIFTWRMSSPLIQRKRGNDSNMDMYEASLHIHKCLHKEECTCWFVQLSYLCAQTVCPLNARSNVNSPSSTGYKHWGLTVTLKAFFWRGNVGNGMQVGPLVQFRKTVLP